MKNKDHLTLEGLNRIVNIKALMNLGLSEFLISEFKNKDFNLTNFSQASQQDKLPLPERKIINTEIIPDLGWLVGFSSGEANFEIKISQNSEYSTGYRVTLRFRISQHERDKTLLETIAKYLEAGKVYKYPNQPAAVFTLFKFSDITDILIPLFEKNPLLGVKSQDFLDFCEAAKLIKDGKHLTLDGINKIINLKSGMNRGRK